MTEIRKADPAARRQAVLLVMAGTFVGALLIVGFERYRAPLIDWLLSEPAEFAKRMKVVVLLVSTVLSAPLIAFAVYFWALGTKVLRARVFPLPGQRVIRDTPVIEGEAAVLRGRGFKILAACLGVATAFQWLLFWRMAILFSKGAP